MSDAGTAFSATMKPRVLNKRKKFKRYELRVPGFGRVGFTRDPGEAKMFQGITYETRLGAIVREPDGKIIDERNFGSGLVTNAGVLALALDGVTTGVGKNQIPAKAKEPFNLFAQLRWHDWGTSETAAATTDIKLTAVAKHKTPNENEAVEAENKLTTNGEGKPKLVSTSKITAGETLGIKEWGIFTQKVLEATTGSPLTGKTATTGTTTGTALTESTEEAKGETLKILVFTEAEEGWGLITKNTTSVVTVPAWYKQSNGAEKEPTATSPYKLRPVMFDHRTFAVINVESGNIIEFPWELEIKSGG